MASIQNLEDFGNFKCKWFGGCRYMCYGYQIQSDGCHLNISQSIGTEIIEWGTGLRK